MVTLVHYQHQELVMDYDDMSVSSSGSSLFEESSEDEENPVSQLRRFHRSLDIGYRLPAQVTPALLNDENYELRYINACLRGPCTYEGNCFSELLKLLERSGVQRLTLKETEFYTNRTKSTDFLSDIITAFPPRRLSGLEIYLPWDELPAALLSGLSEQFRRLVQIPRDRFHLHCNGINSETLFQVLSGMQQAQQQGNTVTWFTINPLRSPSETELIQCLDCIDKFPLGLVDEIHIRKTEISTDSLVAMLQPWRIQSIRLRAIPLLSDSTNPLSVRDALANNKFLKEFSWYCTDYISDLPHLQLFTKGFFPGLAQSKLQNLTLLHLSLESTIWLPFWRSFCDAFAQSKTLEMVELMVDVPDIPQDDFSEQLPTRMEEFIGAFRTNFTVTGLALILNDETRTDLRASPLFQRNRLLKSARDFVPPHDGDPDTLLELLGKIACAPVVDRPGGIDEGQVKLPALYHLVRNHIPTILNYNQWAEPAGAKRRKLDAP